MQLYKYKVIDHIVMILSEQTEVTELHLSDSVFKLFWNICPESDILPIKKERSRQKLSSALVTELIHIAYYG